MACILTKYYSSPFSVKTIATSIFFFFGTISWIQGATFTYIANITLCTATCDGFASYDLGSTIVATFDIDVGPSSSFGDADINSFQFSVFNPALPFSALGDPVTDNPLILDSALGEIASNGSSGTTDASGALNGGQLLLEFLGPPFSENEAFIVIDLATVNGQICLFYETAGCIPGATEALKFEGAIIGTVSVNGLVHISQTMKLEPLNIAPACSTDNLGLIYVDKNTSKLRFCNGTNWVDLNN